MGQQGYQAPPIIAVGYDERRINGNGIEDHKDRYHPVVPEKEKQGGGNREPMREFAPAGFHDEALQIIRSLIEKPSL